MQVVITKNSHCQALPEDFSRNTRDSFVDFQAEQLFTNVRLHFPEGKPIEVHSMVLTAHSRVIQSWLRTQNTGCACMVDQERLTLPQLDLIFGGYRRQTVESLMEILYTGSTLIGAELLMELDRLCREFDIDAGQLETVEEPPEHDVISGDLLEPLETTYLDCGHHCDRRFPSVWALQKHMEECTIEIDLEPVLERDDTSRDPENETDPSYDRVFVEAQDDPLLVEDLTDDYDTELEEGEEEDIEEMEEEPDEEESVPRDHVEKKEAKNDLKAMASQANLSPKVVIEKLLTCYLCGQVAETIASLRLHLVRSHFADKIMRASASRIDGLTCIGCNGDRPFSGKIKLLTHLGLFHNVILKVVKKVDQPEIFMSDKLRKKQKRKKPHWPSKMIGRLPKRKKKKEVIVQSDTDIKKKRDALWKFFNDPPTDELRCHYCSKLFSDRYQLLEHFGLRHFWKDIRTTKPEPEKVKHCSICQLDFDSETNSIKHAATHHSEILRALVNDLPKSLNASTIRSCCQNNRGTSQRAYRRHACTHFKTEILAINGKGPGEQCHLCDRMMTSMAGVIDHVGTAQNMVINLGDYRRKYTNYANHNIFNNDNPEGLRIRNQVCEEGLQDAINYLENEGGEAVVFDATNTTRERRRLLHDTVVKKKGFKLFFVESVCDDETIIDSNIRSVKVTSPDYISFNADQVVEDFKERIKHYEAQYQTLDEELESELSFMKIFNAGEKVLVHKHEGHVESRIVYYLMNIKITPRTIYLTRHGESNYNLQQKLGGDPGLSPRGKDYAQKLGEYMNSLSIPNLLVWTSFMRRTHQTAKHVVGIHERWKTLNELDVGVCDGLTYEEVKGKYPDDFIARDKNKYRYRYPRGESYEDLVARLEPVIMELERHGSVLVVGHQAILRCILAYFEEIDEDELPYLEVPLHTIIKLEPRAYGCHVEFERLNVDCVSTHRPKPKVPGQLQDDIATQLDQIEIHHV
ncbi:hypothetical protein TCAL_12965 [Tigriopus californicus]|uniref:BTB domain-containing protein n=1 Tax=Tigriopus californicus TaxID=6832 RepID=A0A553NB77_TIGCA|nr:hypothetical protein TCAL_12965 [Tigriopus californicus]